MSAQQEVIKRFMKSLDDTNLKGTAALNAAIKVCTSSKYKSIQAVINKMIKDLKKAGSANKFLKNYCGIVLDNDDTGAIIGSDAGGSETKTAESIVPESGCLKNFQKNSFTVNGVTFQLEKNYNSLTSNEKFIWRGLYSWWAKEGMNLIADSYGNNFGFDSNSSATTKKISFGFINDKDNAGAVTHWSWNGNGGTTDLAIKVNEYYYYGIDPSKNSNGLTSSGYSIWYLDRILAHELTHATMAANINYSGELPLFIIEGMAELTHGTDDVRKSAITSLAGDPDRLKAVLTSSSDDGYYEGGYMFLRYLAKQFAGKDIFNSNNNTIVSGSAYCDTIRSTGQKVKVYGKGGDDDIYVGLDKGTVKGGAGNDTLQVYGTNVKIYGESGNDSVVAYSNTDKATLSGGTGNDTFQVYGSNLKIYGESGNDSITAYESADKVTISGGAGNDSLFSDGTNISIDGGKGNDYIHLFNEATNTTITGGKGNDTIKSYSKNNVTYVYKSGEGKDTIDGFNFGTDNIKIYSVPTIHYDYSGNDIIFTIGSTSLTVKDGSGKKITINGIVRSFDSPASKTSALLTEDNFATTDNLSSIVENDLSPTDYKLDTQNFENLSQKNNLITYANK